MEFKCVNCGEKHASYNTQCKVCKREYDSQHIRVSIFLSRLRKNYQQAHGQRVVNNAGVVNTETQSTSIPTHTDVSLVGPEPVTRKQRLSVSVTNRSVVSVSRSVKTTTRVADVKKTMAPVNSSPAENGDKTQQTFIAKATCLTCS